MGRLNVDRAFISQWKQHRNSLFAVSRVSKYSFLTAHQHTKGHSVSASIVLSKSNLCRGNQKIDKITRKIKVYKLR